MRQTLSRSVVAATAATSILSLCGGTAQADTYASGGASDSPGLLSGNSIQAPVDAPVNACGNSVDAVGALNPAFGNSCGDGSGSKGSHHVPAQHAAHRADNGRSPYGGSGHSDSGYGNSGHQEGGYADSGYGDAGYGDSGHGGSGHGRGGHGDHHGDHHGGSFAHGPASDSPGIGSGNSVEVPVHVPVNLCGDTVDIIGVGNGAFGNSCGEHGSYGDDSPGGHGGAPGGYGDDTPPGHPHHPPTDRNIPPGGTPPHTPPSHGGTPPGHPAHPAHPAHPSVAHPRATAPALAETGADANLVGAAAASAALIAGGAVLYRRPRVVAQR